MNNRSYIIILFVVLLVSTIGGIECFSIREAQCQRNCNSSYDFCYKTPNANYSECDSSHRSCMSGCRVIGCKEECENTDRNCSINRRGYGCAGFSLLSCYIYCR